MENNGSRFKIIHHADQPTIDEMYHEYSPVFILSTGRSGSKFIVKLLNLSANVIAYHEPAPILAYFSDYAYHHQGEVDILANLLNGARMELILEVFIQNKIYVESNQCLTFFAPVISELFKKSKFVHQVRHPGDFVRSAIRKGWHKNDSIWESGRVKMADKNLWAKMDHVEKLGWVWNTTNRFIEDFKNRIDPGRIMELKVEDLYENNDKVQELLQFIGTVGIPAESINKIQKEKVNKFRIGPNEPPNIKKIQDFPLYTEWNEQMKNKLKRLANDLANRYKYKL